MFEKLEQFLVDLDLESKELTNVSLNVNEYTNLGTIPDSASATSATAHEVMRGICISQFVFTCFKVLNINNSPTVGWTIVCII